MHSTLTSKGQLTLPKRAREALKLRAGQRLVVEISRDGRLLLTPQRVDPLSICGVLPKPASKRVTIEDMDRGIGEHLVRKHARLGAQSGRRRKR